MFSAGTSVWISFRAQDLTIWPKLRFLTTSDPSLVMPGNNVANVMEVCKRVLKIHVSLALRPISYKMCAPLTDMCALCSSLRVPERRLMRDLHRYTDHQLIGLFFSDSTHSTASFFMTFPSIVGFYILVFLSSCRPRGWFFPYHKDPNSIFAVTLSESTVIWGQWPVAPLDSDRFSIKALCCFFCSLAPCLLMSFPPQSSHLVKRWTGDLIGIVELHGGPLLHWQSFLIHKVHSCIPIEPHSYPYILLVKPHLHSRNVVKKK